MTDYDKEQPSDLRPRTYHDRAYRPPLHRQPYHRPNTGAPPPEDVIAEQEIIVERKRFEISLRSNSRGQFIRVIESGVMSTRRNSIVIPLAGVANLITAIEHVLPPREEPEPAK